MGKTSHREKAGCWSEKHPHACGEDELSQLYDARAVALMRDAMKYRDLVAKRQEVKPKATPVVNARPKTVGSEQSKIKTRLAKSGTVQDAAAYFKTLL